MGELLNQPGLPGTDARLVQGENMVEDADDHCRFSPSARRNLSSSSRSVARSESLARCINAAKPSFRRPSGAAAVRAASPALAASP